MAKEIQLLVGILLLTSCRAEMSQPAVDTGGEISARPTRGNVAGDYQAPDAGGSLKDGSALEALQRSDLAVLPTDLSVFPTDLVVLPGADVSPVVEVGPDVVVRTDLAQTPDLRSAEDATVIPDTTPPRPEAGKEAAVCPTTCFTGCYNGCGSNGQCKACATCTCEVVTGACHC